MDNSSSGGGGVYVVCVSVDGDVYAIANSTYHTSYDPGGVTLYPGDIMWHKKITSSVAGQTPHVISSPFRYKEWIYVTVGWMNISGQFVDSGVVRISAVPPYLPDYGGFSTQVQDYFRTGIASRIYSSPALSLEGTTPGVVFGVRNPEQTEGHVYRIPIQSVPLAPITGYTWRYTITVPEFNAVNEIGSPSVAYGKVFFGTHGTGTYVAYAVDERLGSEVWKSIYMRVTENCGSLHPPAAFDGQVFVGYDEGDIISFNAEAGDIIGRNLNEAGRTAPSLEYTTPVVTTGGTVIVHQSTPSSFLWNLDASLFTNLQATSLANTNTYGASPAVAYLRGYTNNALNGRWTYLITDSDQSGACTLRSVLKPFAW